jgi:purine-binding chemotaxis protein CheW
VLLSIDATHYAVPEAYVTELERVPRITMVPQVPQWVRGVTSVRGDIVSVIDMRSFLGLEPHQPATARMLVVRLLDEPFATGLLVDAVDRIVTVPAGAITAPASPLEGPLSPFLRGVCEVGDRLVAVLDIERLLRSSAIRQFDEPNDLHADAPTQSVEDN